MLRLPSIKNIRLAAWLIIIGSLGRLFFPQYAIFDIILFVFGFGLLLVHDKISRASLECLTYIAVPIILATIHLPSIDPFQANGFLDLILTLALRFIILITSLLAIGKIAALQTSRQTPKQTATTTATKA